MTRVINLIVILSLLLAGAAVAEDWIVQTVNNEGDAGLGTFAWTDSAGDPHIVYLRDKDGPCGLYHTAFTTSGWSIKEIAVYSLDIGSPGSFDATVDLSGFPHIAWLMFWPIWKLIYIHEADSGWSIDTAITLVHGGSQQRATSIALDNRDDPHILFQENDNSNNLLRAYIDTITSLWIFDTLAAAECGDWYSIAINNGDSIYVAYHTVDGHLKLALHAGSGWGGQYVDLDDDVGKYCDLILDENGLPHIAYYDATNTRLKYATPSASPKAGRTSTK